MPRETVYFLFQSNYCFQLPILKLQCEKKESLEAERKGKDFFFLITRTVTFNAK